MRKQAKRPARAAKSAAAHADVKPADDAAPEDHQRPGSDAPYHSSQAVTRLAAEVEMVQAEFAALQAKLGSMQAKLVELEAKVDVDPLLGIFNRHGFERELTRALAHVKRYHTRAALVFVDVDDFKAINDAHGHPAGDAVLQAVAETLTRHVRGSDTVARVGGDEFVVLLWELRESDALAKSAALEEAIAATRIPWGAKSLSVGASAGITLISAGDDASTLLTRADQAMYARKAVRKHR